MSEINKGKTAPPSFMNNKDNFSRSSLEKPAKINITEKIEEDFSENAEIMAKDTGLLWLYEGASPIDEQKDTFSTQAQFSTSQAQFSNSQVEDNNYLEYSMGNLSLNTNNKAQNFSSNSLQGFGNIQELRAPVPKYHNLSSQVVNHHPPLENFYQETKWLYFDFEINDDFKIMRAPLSYFSDDDTNELVYYRPIAEQIVLYNYNCYIKCTLYFPPVHPRSLQLIEKVYLGYINLFDLRELNGRNISLWLFANDFSKMIINCNYANDYQHQCYILNNIMMNLKFPGPKPKSPIQRNSYMGHPTLNIVPPRFGSSTLKNPKSKLSGFAANRKFINDFHRVKSPSAETLDHHIQKKRPNFKRSHQDIVAPLVPGLDWKADFYLYKDLAKEKLTSDSLSDDQDNIKEVENDDTEEEKYSTKSSTRPRKKQSSDNFSKLNFP